MSDRPDNTGQVRRRTPRSGDGGAPVTGALAIVLAVVAVVAGFLILRSISDDGTAATAFPGSGDQPADTADGDDSAAGQSTVPTLPPTTTQPELVTVGASVIVANANEVNGSAGTMTRALESGPGFTMVDPTNASSSVGNVDESVIYFDESIPAAKAVAESVARAIGGVGTIAPLAETPPTADGTVNGAGVLLVLGNDKAGKTLAELAPGEVAAPAVTSPPVAGDTTTTTAG